MLFQHVLLDFAHLLVRGTLGGYFLQLAVDDGVQVLHLIRVGLINDLHHFLFFRIFRQSAVAAYAIRAAFLFTDFFGINHVECLGEEAHQ